MEYGMKVNKFDRLLFILYLFILYFLFYLLSQKGALIVQRKLSQNFIRSATFKCFIKLKIVQTQLNL